MSDVVKERPKIINPSGIGGEPKKPSQYRIILKDEFGVASLCNVTILKDVFKLSFNEAKYHFITAAKSGSSEILKAEKDIAETLTQNANEAIRRHMSHDPAVGVTRYISLKIG